MGIFSFLFGGKKSKEKVEKAAKATPAVKAASAVPAMPDSPVIIPVGMVQAKLRLKLAAALRTGQHAAAYEAARALADIQVRAGRKNVARVWQQQAERIKADGGLAA